MAKAESIKITHFINPHMFWFKYEANIFNNEFFELEERMQEHYRAEKFRTKYAPHKGDKVAVHSKNMNRWIRGVVDHIVEFHSSETKYIIWTLDHGLLIETTEASLRRLPEHFSRIDTDLVFFGGINQVVPAALRYDFKSDEARLETCDIWSQTAVDNIENLVRTAAEVRFEPEIETKDGQLLGNLQVINNENVTQNVMKILTKTSNGIVIEDGNEFLQHLEKIGTNRIPRWLTNNGNLLAFKFGKNSVPMYSHLDHQRRNVKEIETEDKIELAAKIASWQETNEKLKAQDKSIVDLSDYLKQMNVGTISGMLPNTENFSEISLSYMKAAKQLLEKQKNSPEKCEDNLTTDDVSTTYSSISKLDRLKKIKSKQMSKKQEINDKNSVSSIDGPGSVTSMTKLDRMKKIRAKNANNASNENEAKPVESSPKEDLPDNSGKDTEAGSAISSISRIERYKRLKAKAAQNVASPSKVEERDDKENCILNKSAPVVSEANELTVEQKDERTASASKLDRIKKMRSKQTQDTKSQQPEKSVHVLTPQEVARMHRYKHMRARQAQKAAEFNADTPGTPEAENKNADAENKDADAENKDADATKDESTSETGSSVSLSKLDRLKKIRAKQSQLQKKMENDNDEKKKDEAEATDDSTMSKLERLKKIRSKQIKNKGSNDMKTSDTKDKEQCDVTEGSRSDSSSKLDRLKKIRSKHAEAKEEVGEKDELTQNNTPSQEVENMPSIKAEEKVPQTKGMSKLDRLKKIRAKQNQSQSDDTGSNTSKDLTDNLKETYKSPTKQDRDSEVEIIKNVDKVIDLTKDSKQDEQQVGERNALKLDRYKQIRAKQTGNSSMNQVNEVEEVKPEGQTVIDLTDTSSKDGEPNVSKLDRYKKIRAKQNEGSISDGSISNVPKPVSTKTTLNGEHDSNNEGPNGSKSESAKEPNQLSEADINYNRELNEINDIINKLSFDENEPPSLNGSIGGGSSPMNKYVNTKADTKSLTSKSDTQSADGTEENKETKVQALLHRLSIKAKSKSPSVHSDNTSKSDKKITIPGGYDVTNLPTETKVDRKRKSTCLNQEPQTCCLESNLTKHLVLVHGKHTIKPLDKLVNANFCEDVHRELEYMRFTEIYRIQAYTWPNMMRGNSLVVVNGTRTGKTMSYLPALCSLIKLELHHHPRQNLAPFLCNNMSDKETQLQVYDRKQTLIKQMDRNILILVFFNPVNQMRAESEIPEGVGPIGIVIAPNAVEVEHIAKYARRFFNNSVNKLEIVESFGIRNEVRAETLLLNGCALLVATPGSTCRLMGKDLSYFDNKRIAHVVFDNIDKMYDNFKPEILQILKKFCNRPPAESDLPTQLVVTSRIWRPFLSAFFQLCSNTQLCIGSYIDAAVYGRAIFYTKFVEQKSKIGEVFRFIQERPYQTQKLIIVCNEDEEVTLLTEELKSASCYVVPCTSQSSFEDIMLAKHWHDETSEQKGILVCTDSVLPEIKCNSAQNLIHFSLPNSWSKFNFRFSALLNYHENLVVSQNLKNSPAKVLVLLDENNNSQLPRLIQFFKEHGFTQIRPQIMELYHRILVSREEERVTLHKDFCPLIAEFGKCTVADRCTFRHVLTQSDAAEEHTPQEGYIKVKILHVISPTHFCVRLLEHRAQHKSNWKKVRSSSLYLKFNLEFSQYFSNEKNHKIHWPINEGDMCVINDRNAYHRCQIITVQKKSSKSTSDAIVQVKLIDSGKVIPCKESQLLALPEKFEYLPPQAVTMFMTGIAPHDYEQQWDSETTSRVRNLVAKAEAANNVHVEAKITFSLRDKIWVNNIILIETLKSISTNASALNLKKTLLDRQYGIICPSHVDILMEMASQCGLMEMKYKDIDSGDDDGMILDEDEARSEASFVSCVTNTQIQRNKIQHVVNKSKKTDSRDDQKKLDDECDLRKPTEIKDQSTNKVPIVKRSANAHQFGIRHFRDEIESWEQFNDNGFTRVSIGAFYSPNSFYVQKLDNLDKMEELYKAMDNYAEANRHRIMTKPEIGKNCLAMFDGKFNRAKITKVVCDNPSDKVKVHLFFTDIGMNDVQNLSDTLICDDYLVKFMPFQAIRCKLIGIEPTENGIWFEEVCDRIYDSVLDVCEFIYARSLQEEPPLSDGPLALTRYGVVLFDYTDKKAKNLNQAVVKGNLGAYDPKTRHFLDVIFNYQEARDISDNESEQENWDHCNYVRSPLEQLKESQLERNIFENFADYDIQMTEDDVLDMIKKFDLPFIPRLVPVDECEKPVNKSKPLPLIEEESCKIEEIKEGAEIKEGEEIKEEVDDEGASTKSIPRTMPLLVNLNKPPRVLWTQFCDTIKLFIAAPDVNDYYLKVTKSDLTFIAVIQGELKVLIINFFGYVFAEDTIHRIRGLNVVVQLQKALIKFQWPRLTSNADKCEWLKYDYNSIILEDNEIVNVDTFSDRRISSDSEFEGSDDNISEDFENADRVFDPLTDDFGA